MFLTSGLSPTTGVYISIFKVVLAGNKRLIELRYEMDIVMFNLLFKFQIHSRKRKLAFFKKKQSELKFWPLDLYYDIQIYFSLPNP